MKRYKDTFVGKNSALASALEKSDAEAKKVYDETTANFNKLYSKEDREYFMNKHRENT